MSASPVVRSVRAAVFAVLCVLLAAGGHALATGAAPPVWAQVSGVAPVFAAGYLLGRRERTLAPLGGATLGSQGALHLAFDAVRPHAAMAVHSARLTPPHALTPHATTAHLAAGLLLTWWLRRGEAALWSLLRWAAAFVPGLVAWWQGRGGCGAEGNRTGRVCRGAVGPRPLREVLLRYAVHRRGPPTGVPYAI